MGIGGVRRLPSGSSSLVWGMAPFSRPFGRGINQVVVICEGDQPGGWPKSKVISHV